MLTQAEILQIPPLESVTIPEWEPKQAGKVRDIYHRRRDQRILITTDRFSAFDRVLGLIPCKGQVLNQISAWFFEQTRDIVPNHLIEVPDPNVSIVKEAEALPLEVIVRGYITGVTSTSLWTLYAAGERNAYGVTLPEGLKKNDPLPTPLLTPTTKAAEGGHDQRLTPQEIIDNQIIPTPLWKQIETVATALFQRGSELAQKAGLILVDTKYEFGLIDGQLALIDEVHTPDSSRYWLAGSHESDLEPENYDKEYLRRWLVGQNYRGDGEPPILPDDIIAEAALRYISVFERLTGQNFVPGEQPAAERIVRQLKRFE